MICNNRNATLITLGIGGVLFGAFGRAGALHLLSISRQGLFFIPLLFAANAAFGVRGLFAAQPASDLLTLLLGIALLVFFLRSVPRPEMDA